MALSSSLPSRGTNWTCDLPSFLGAYPVDRSARFLSRTKRSGSFSFPLPARWFSRSWVRHDPQPEHLSSSSRFGKMGKDESAVNLEYLPRSALTNGLSTNEIWRRTCGLLPTVSWPWRRDAFFFSGLGGRVKGRGLTLPGLKTRGFGSQTRESTLSISVRSDRLRYSTPILLSGGSGCRGIHLGGFEVCSSAPGCKSENKGVGGSESQSDTSSCSGISSRPVSSKRPSKTTG